MNNDIGLLTDEYIKVRLEYKDQLENNSEDIRLNEKLSFKSYELKDKIFTFSNFPEIFLKVLKKEPKLYEELLATLHVYDFDEFKKFYERIYKISGEKADKNFLNRWKGMIERKRELHKETIERYNKWRESNEDKHQEILSEFNKIFDKLEKEKK